MPFSNNVCFHLQFSVAMVSGILDSSRVKCRSQEKSPWIMPCCSKWAISFLKRAGGNSVMSSISKSRSCKNSLIIMEISYYMSIDEYLFHFTFWTWFLDCGLTRSWKDVRYGSTICSRSCPSIIATEASILYYNHWVAPVEEICFRTDVYFPWSFCLCLFLTPLLITFWTVLPIFTRIYSCLEQLFQLSVRTFHHCNRKLCDHHNSLLRFGKLEGGKGGVTKNVPFQFCY